MTIIAQYLDLRRGQSNYIDPFLTSRYHSLITKNPLLVESDFKYWFLGYFLGDGHLESTGFSVRISSNDEQVVSLLYASFGVSNIPISLYKRMQKSHYIYIFHTANREVFSFLSSYGFTHNKSKTGWYGWDLIPEQFRPAFLRGLYESDGTYSIQHEGSSRSLSWLGHASYIVSIAHYLEVVPYEVKAGVWKISLCSSENRSFIRKMYPSSKGLGTEQYPSNLRKAYKALEVLNESVGNGR